MSSIGGRQAIDGPYFDEEERDLIESIETALESRGAPQVDPQEQARLKAMWREALVETERKRPVTVRLQERDLRRLRVIAQEKGIPYQTLIGSILHQYVTGRIVEMDPNRS